MDINPIFTTGIDNIENEFYNVIIPLLERVTSGPRQRTLDNLRVQTIGDYINKKGTTYYSVIDGLVRDRYIPKELLDCCLVISIRKNLYEDFFKRFVIKTNVGPKDIDLRTSGSACMIFENPHNKKKICIVMCKDMNEMTHDLKKDNLSLFHPEIPVEIAVQSVLLHELVHAEDFISASGFRKVESYKNWREIHAYSVQFEWIDKKVGRPLILESFGTRSYKSAAEKFIMQVIKK